MLDVAIILMILSPYLTIIPGVGLLYIISNRKVPIYLNPLNMGLFLLFIWAFISGIVNMSLISTIASLALLFYLFLSIYLQHIIFDESSIQAFIHKVWKYSLFVAVLGVVEKIASYYFDLTWIASFYLNDPIEYVYRIYSTFGNPNVAGGWFAVMIIVTLYFFERNQYHERIYYTLILAVFTVALVYTGSRGATIGLEVAILVYALLTKNKFSRAVLLSTFFIVIVLALLSPEINLDHPLNSRFPIWINALTLFVQKPITGWGIFGILDQMNKIHAHNTWFTFLTMFGTVGLSIYLWIKVYLFKSIYLLYKNNVKLVPLIAAIQALIVVHGVVDFIMMTPQGGVLFFASAAITVSLTRSYEPYDQTELAEGWTTIKSILGSAKSANS
ncbi:MAG: O-antigen ligase family protein [Firmicutes bacterium]|nr:O-antigen ligase family protein [Bacillota bacterium]